MWRVDPRNPGEEAVECASLLLRKGGVVIFPTETFYGLGGCPGLENTIERIYRIKGRMLDKPLPLIAAGMGDVRRAAAEWPAAAERLARVFWPGPLTLVLLAAPDLPPVLHARTGKIAVRVSSHPVAQALASGAGGLLISTSANLANQPPQTDTGDLASSLLAQVDGMIDAGSVPGGAPSTIVDISTPLPRLVRSGCVSWESIQRVLRPSHDESFYQPISE